jgi:hypothetical protein
MPYILPDIDTHYDVIEQVAPPGEQVVVDVDEARCYHHYESHYLEEPMSHMDADHPAPSLYDAKYIETIITKTNDSNSEHCDEVKCDSGHSGDSGIGEHSRKSDSNCDRTDEYNSINKHGTSEYKDSHKPPVSDDKHEHSSPSTDHACTYQNCGTPPADEMEEVGLHNNAVSQCTMPLALALSEMMLKYFAPLPGNIHFSSIGAKRIHSVSLKIFPVQDRQMFIRTFCAEAYQLEILSYCSASASPTVL